MTRAFGTCGCELTRHLPNQAIVAGMDCNIGCRPMSASTTAQAALPVGLQRSGPARSEAGSESRAAGLGLEEGFDEIPGILASMLVAFGRSGIRTIEDLAACATDDLLGWTETSGDAVTMHPGILSEISVSRKQCDAIILQARVRAGWIEATALTA